VVKGVKESLYSLRYIDISVGTGPLAEPSTLGKSQADSKIMWYTVHYTGYLAKDGTKFDSSVDRGSPITFPYGVQKVIPGWDTGFEGMHIGGKRRLFVPYQLAYGASGRPPVIPAKADLIFDVELIGVSDKPPAQPEAPKPADASKPADSSAKPATPAGAAPATTAPAAKPATPAAPAATPAPAAKPAAPATSTPAPAAPAKPETK
jgi:peptidylprolyl isomerase